MKLVAPILVLLLTFSAHAQEWQENYSDALALAGEQNKPIILVFSGSDWCAPCIKLDRAIWQSDRFKAYSKDHYILYKADFPRKKANRLAADLAEQHAALAERFNPSGHFPLVVVLNAQEKVLGQLGFEKDSPEGYISRLNAYLK